MSSFSASVAKNNLTIIVDDWNMCAKSVRVPLSFVVCMGFINRELFSVILRFFAKYGFISEYRKSKSQKI